MWGNKNLHSLTDRKRQYNTTHIIAYWIPKATNTVLEYVILFAFPLQQWRHRCASILSYTYFACLLVFWTYCDDDDYYIVVFVVVYLLQY